MISDFEKAIFDFQRVFVVLSNVCNCRCIMCNNRHHSLGRSSLNSEDVHRIGRFAIENNVQVMDFSGGEPFQFPGIDQLIREFGNSDMILNIVTNGTIMTKAHLDAIADAKSLRLQLSTHGLGDVEDTIKGRSTASSQVEKTLRELIGVGATVSLATVVQKHNLHQLVDIYRHFASVPYTHHSFVMYEPMGDLTSMHVDPSAVRITADRAGELRRQMSGVIDEARADGKAVNLDHALVEKYVERTLTESPTDVRRQERFDEEPSARGDGEPRTADSGGVSDAAAPASSPGDTSAGHEERERSLSHPGLLCTIPRRNLFIDHTGDVAPCFHFDWKALNPNCSIGDTSIEELIFSREYLDMILTAIGPGGCRGCDAACYIWDPDFRRRATQPDKGDKLLALLSEREHGAESSLASAAARAAYLDETLLAVKRSTSWRLTAPLRRLGRVVRRSRGGT